MNAEKQTLRHEAIRHRDRIDPGSEDLEQTRTLFFETIKPEPGQVVASYCPKGREFDPGMITEGVIEAGIACALPVVRQDSRVLDFALWNESITLEPGPFKILQPAVNENTIWVEPDIVLVPFLAFDRRGGRLGYGGGYYDATLRALRAKKKVIAVGVGYAQQAVLFNLPREDHDEPMDWVITPQRAHFFE